MGAYKYVNEIWKKKNSDVMKFVLRLRCWEYRQMPKIHRTKLPSRPEKARRLGFKAKKGILVYRVRVRRGGRKKIATKGIVYGKPVNQGVSQYKSTMSLRAIAERRVGARLPSLRDGTHKYFEVILVDPMLETVRNDPSLNWLCKATNKRRECRGLTSAGRKHRGLGKGHRFNKTKGGSRKACWKRHNTLSLRRYR